MAADVYRTWAHRLNKLFTKGASALAIDHERGGRILEIPYPGPDTEDAIAEMLAEMDDERFGADGLRQLMKERDMKAETQKFFDHAKQAAHKAVSAASGEREKCKALARAKADTARAGFLAEKAAFDEAHAESLAGVDVDLAATLEQIDAIFDGK